MGLDQRIRLCGRDGGVAPAGTYVTMLLGSDSVFAKSYAVTK